MKPELKPELKGYTLMTHALTHKNNPKITRATLPALLPTILAGLFILAGCGGSALPIPVIATESTDVANNLESTAPDSILLSVGEQPPVDTVKSADSTTTPPADTPIVQVQKQEPKPKPKPKQEAKPAPPPAPAPKVPTPDSQEQVEKQIPAPVFEVAVAPARPPQRSFSQSQPEPQTSTETVTRSDATGESNHDDGAITFADWTGSFSFSGDKKLPTQAETTTITITATPISASTPTTRTKTAGIKNEFLQGGVGGRLDETVYRTDSTGKFLNSDGNLLNNDGVFTKEGEARVIISGLVANRGGLNFATATFGGRKLGGKATNGVAFFRGFGALNPTTVSTGASAYSYTVSGTRVNNEVHNYAGLYSGTNLGAPVNTTDPEASWNGRLRSIGYYDFDTDFTLIVKFSTRKLEVTKFTNPKNANQTFEIKENDASYDANGVITGIVRFKRGDVVATNIGVLTGLIGADGAVGAFLATGQNNENGGNTLTAQGDKNGLLFGFGSHGYAGGFVASPTAVANEDVTIDAWTGSFDNLRRDVKRFTLNNGEPRNAFLLRDDPAKRPNWKKKEGGFLSLRTFIDGTDDTVNNPTSLGGDATDGVDFFPADITIIGTEAESHATTTQRAYYAGIWDTTDLGVAIPYRQDFNNVPSAEWNGKFSVLQGANARFDTDFKLTVDFVNAGFRTITAIEAGAEDYYLSGRYDADGLLTGVVRRAANASNSSPHNGLISGLIGQEGLVAAFVSNIGGSGMDAENKDTIKGGTGSSGYAGGFVAISTPAIDVYSLPNYDAIPVTLAGLENTATPARGFLRIADGEELNTAGITSPTPFTGRRDSTAGDKGFGDGYTFVRNGGYAAILPTTYLGMPRPVGDGQATDARWTGTYSLGGDLATNAPITFDINFRVSTLTGTAPLTSSSSNNITINTTFGPTGVMHGTFSTDTTTPIEAGDTRVMGLIGTEGLVGIMHGQDTAGAVVSGGFVASPSE